MRDGGRAPGGHRPSGSRRSAAARTENGEHLDEEEREAIPDFIKSASLDMRHELAMKWARFWAQHPEGRGIDTSDRDPEAYIEDNS